MDKKIPQAGETEGSRSTRTIIIIDGRGANAQFLRDYLKRNWLYKFDYINDQHIFYLNEKPLGKYNKLQLEFYKN